MRGPAPLKVKRPETASQSLLARVDCCPFSGGLYIKHKGGPQSAEMARGECFHAWHEQAVLMMVEQGEPAMPGDVGRDLMQAIIEERTDLAIPGSEQDICRLMAWNWAEATVLDLDAIIGVEIMLALQVGDWTIRGKIDRAEIRDGAGYVIDLKTSLGIPTGEAFERDFQTQFYALLLAEGVPEGDDLPLGRGLNMFRLFNVFPRLRREDGSLVDRDATLDRRDIADIRRTVEAHLAKLEHGLSEGEWTASPGSHCHTCPAAAECPIPPVERDYVIGTDGDAVELAERLIRLDEERDGVRKSLKGWVEQHDAVQAGDFVFELGYRESESLRDKETLKDVLAEAGHDPSDFFATRQSMHFSKRKAVA